MVLESIYKTTIPEQDRETEFIKDLERSSLDMPTWDVEKYSLSAKDSAM